MSQMKRLAVLIDAENAPAQIAAGLFEEIARLGEASVRRIYGDFSGGKLKAWAQVLANHAIIPHHNYAHVAGKNASDIALVIDAMDLLHSKRFDGFCLISSDSDFTRLAARIREEGLEVYGFGEQKTPSSFRQACKRFFYIENLLQEPRAPAEPSKPTRLGNGAEASFARVTEKLDTAVDLVRRALDQIADDDGWGRLARIGAHILQLAPDFDTRTYGFSKLSLLITASQQFNTRLDAGNHISIRLRVDPD